MNIGHTIETAILGAVLGGSEENILKAVQSNIVTTLTTDPTTSEAAVQAQADAWVDETVKTLTGNKVNPIFIGIAEAGLTGLVNGFIATSYSTIAKQVMGSNFQSAPPTGATGTVQGFSGTPAPA
jgi:hypothetical protein